MSGRLTTAVNRLRAPERFIPSKSSDWSPAIFAAIIVLFPALVKWLYMDVVPLLLRSTATLGNPNTQQVSYGSDTLRWAFSATDPTLRFAFIVGAFCLTIATLVLLLSLLVHLFSGDAQRSEKAGKIVRRTLTFLITSGGGVWAYLGFFRKS